MIPREPIEELQLPDSLQVEPVGHCARRWTKGEDGLRDEGAPFSAPALYRYEAFCRLIDQYPGLAELKLRGIGEPLLHPRFFDMVRYACARGVKVSTETDLPALSERRAEECVASGLRHLYVRVRPPSGLVFARLRRLAAAKRKLNSAWPALTLLMSDVKTPEEPARAGVGCDRPWRRAYISVAGEAKPCGMAPPYRESFGNVEREGMARIWNGEAFRAWRSRLASGDLPALCRGCPVYRS
jgi:radical SAM protein with 4Fe4S-binding SPASM domain